MWYSSCSKPHRRYRRTAGRERREADLLGMGARCEQIEQHRVRLFRLVAFSSASA